MASLKNYHALLSLKKLNDSLHPQQSPAGPLDVECNGDIASNIVVHT